MNELFSELNEFKQTDADTLRIKFTLYLKNQLERLNSDVAEAVEVAYNIAGLAATDFARLLDSADPIDEILTIAGELEVNPKNAEVLRNELVEKIRQLP